MYKVLLVDDERIIREGIASLIDWTRFSLILSGTAQNGIEALKMIDEEQPDIVITDMKMPVFDGLQLIKVVHNQYPDIMFIILSGYGEFDLANAAMKYGVKHYMLKPCNENKIVEVLEEVKRELEQRKQIENYIKKSKYDIEKMLPLVKEQFLRDYIMNRAYTKDEGEYYCELLQVAKDGMRLILLQPEGELTLEEVFTLSGIANEQFDQGDVYLNTALINKVLLLIRDLFDEDVLDFIKRIKNSFKYYNATEITVYYSERFYFEDAPAAYREAKELLKYAFYLGEGSIITKKDIENYCDKVQNEELYYDYNRISAVVRCGKSDDVNSEIKNFFDRLKALKLEMTIAKTYCIELFLAIIRQCKSGEMEMYTKRMQDISRMDSIDQIEEFIKETGNKLTMANYEGIVRSNSKLVSTMIHYVSENIGNAELSLKWLANNKLYMNVGYLGKLFTKETGDRFSQFLMRMRIEKAKAMIDECEAERVYEVAERVGLGDNPQYFSHIFKTYTGLTPTEYFKSKVYY
jgi:two-component system response regulator YesN